MEEDTEESSQSGTRVPGCCTDCQDYENYRHHMLCGPSGWGSQDKESVILCYILLNASKNGHLDCVKACLARRIDINIRFLKSAFRTERYTPLCFATELGHDDCVEALIKAGAEIDADILLLAGKFGSERCTKLFLEARGDVSKILCPAASNNRQNIVSLLIASGADVNITNNW